MNMIYVLNKDGEPLMPSTRWRHIKKQIKLGKAVKISCKPFVVQLLYEVPNKVQPLTMGIDTGRTNIGISVVSEEGEEVYSAELETRNKDIPKLMKERAMNRRKHRNYGRRKKRIRRAIKNNTTTQKECKEQKQVTATKTVGVIERVLPGYENPIKCVGIKNKEARFNNRKRKEGWLTPTAAHLLRTHLNMVNKVRKLLPISKIVLEVNKFDFASMENPKIPNWQYQRGPLHGYNSLKDAVAYQQGNHCLLCERGIEQYHHIVPKSKGGSDTIENMVGLCAEHHGRVVC